MTAEYYISDLIEDLIKMQENAGQGSSESVIRHQLLEASLLMPAKKDLNSDLPIIEDALSKIEPT